MARIRLRDGVAISGYGGRAPLHGVADLYRRILELYGLDTKVVLDPLEAANLEQLADKLDKEYNLRFSFDDQDVEDLRLAIARSAGAHATRICFRFVNPILHRVNRFVAACEELVEAAGLMDEGFVDLDQVAPIDLIVQQLVRQGTDHEVGNARARVATIDFYIRPLLLAAGAVASDLTGYTGQAGRPSAAAEVDPFCNAIFQSFRRHGVETKYSSGPNEKRPGALIEAARSLQRHLPSPMRQNSPAAWSKRFRFAAERATASGRVRQGE